MRKYFLSRYIYLFSGHNKQIMHLHSRCTIIFINGLHIVYAVRGSINSVCAGGILRASGEINKTRRKGGRVLYVIQAESLIFWLVKSSAGSSLSSKVSSKARAFSWNPRRVCSRRSTTSLSLMVVACQWPALLNKPK